MMKKIKHNDCCKATMAYYKIVIEKIINKNDILNQKINELHNILEQKNMLGEDVYVVKKGDR